MGQALRTCSVDGSGIPGPISRTQARARWIPQSCHPRISGEKNAQTTKPRQESLGRKQEWPIMPARLVILYSCPVIVCPLLHVIESNLLLDNGASSWTGVDGALANDGVKDLCTAELTTYSQGVYRAANPVGDRNGIGNMHHGTFETACEAR
jgi:hypothetical protein